jgi:hypothetical protein
MAHSSSRRSFFQKIGLGSLAALAAQGWGQTAGAQAADAKILGEAGVKTAERPKQAWRQAAAHRSEECGLKPEADPPGSGFRPNGLRWAGAWTSMVRPACALASRRKLASAMEAS